MAVIILYYVSLYVYLDSLLSATYLSVTFLSHVICIIQYYFWCPPYHSIKLDNSSSYGEILLSVAGFFSFFCFDCGGAFLDFFPISARGGK